MNIVYASDEGYCQHMAVSIASLIEHNKSEQLTFHILSDGISMEKEDQLRAMVRSYGKKIVFYPIEHLMEEMKGQIYGLDTGIPDHDACASADGLDPAADGDEGAVPRL